MRYPRFSESPFKLDGINWEQDSGRHQDSGEGLPAWVFRTPSHMLPDKLAADTIMLLDVVAQLCARLEGAMQ